MCKGRNRFCDKVFVYEYLSRLNVSGAELRIILSLLSDQEDYNPSLKEIASRTTIPYDTVTRAVYSLKQRGILIQLRIGRPGRKSKWEIFPTLDPELMTDKGDFDDLDD